jgi:hypothetical protein
MAVKFLWMLLHPNENVDKYAGGWYKLITIFGVSENNISFIPF